MFDRIKYGPSSVDFNIVHLIIFSENINEMYLKLVKIQNQTSNNFTDYKKAVEEGLSITISLKYICCMISHHCIVIKDYYIRSILHPATVKSRMEPLSRNESGRFDALRSDSTHHFFRNASTKSGSLRFS